MDSKKILKQLNKELTEKTKYYSYTKFESDERVLVVSIYNGVSLSFCIRDDVLILIREQYHIANLHFEYDDYDIAIGDIIYDNIISAMNLFYKYGRVKTVGTSMSELLNNRFMKTKSARKIN